MTDFEDRLSSALRSAGDDAPEAAGLASAARRRAGARRRRTALTSVAAVVAVAGVVGGMAAMLGNDDAGEARVAEDPTPTEADVVAGPPRRVETWRDVSVQVPDDWAYGALSTWCINGDEPGDPVVERAGGVVAAIACDPLNGYGVQFGDGAAFDAAQPPGKLWRYSRGEVQMYPDGAWMGYQRTDDAMVLVVLPTRQEAEAVLGSFEQVTGLDANGCAARLPHAMSSPGDGVMRLCRYTADGWLEQSEILTGNDALKAVDALNAAPTRSPERCPESANQAAIHVWSGDLSGLVRLEGCPGVFGWGGEERDLTSDVLYWVISPGWFGGVEGDVPMPDKLRQ